VQRLTRRNRDRIAKQIRGLKADAMIFAGITQNRAPALWRAVHRRNRRIDLYGSDGVAESAFTERIPRSSRSRTFITNPTLHPFAYPQPGKDFFNRFAARYGSEPEPYAIYGFEAMSLALDALARGGNTREGAVGAFFATRDRPSVLGTYSIDPMGDTTLTDYGVYRVSARGELVFSRVVAARP
jgi:branched-chain amino acid transport system substrate-binding protein